MENKSIIKEINKHGYSFNALNDLLNIGKKDKVLIPIIVKYIRSEENIMLKELLVRAIGVKGFYEVTEVLLDEYLKSEDMMYKWAIGNSIYNICDYAYIHEYIDIVKNDENGMSRQMIILTLGKSKDTEALEALKQLLKSKAEISHVIEALSYFNSTELKSLVEPFCNDNNKRVRNVAQKFISRVFL